MDQFRHCLGKLANALETAGEAKLARQISELVLSDDSAISAFLVSNELWGGSGSVADQAGIGTRQVKRTVEAVLIELGELQMKVGLTNVRTSMWTSAFKEWKKMGI